MLAESRTRCRSEQCLQTSHANHISLAAGAGVLGMIVVYCAHMHAAADNGGYEGGEAGAVAGMTKVRVIKASNGCGKSAGCRCG